MYLCNMERICKKHGLTKFREEGNGFNKRWRCCKCGSEAVQRRRDNIKILAIEYKGSKCQICGYDKHIGALEFHHLEPSSKEFGIGAKGYTRSWDKVKNELDKCILLCANCHRELHGVEA